jgi:hypothetical protein
MDLGTANHQKDRRRLLSQTMKEITHVGTPFICQPACRTDHYDGHDVDLGEIPSQ